MGSILLALIVRTVKYLSVIRSAGEFMQIKVGLLMVSLRVGVGIEW